MSGYVKLHRCMLDDGLWQSLTDGMARAFVGLLLQVNWVESEFGCKGCGKIITLPPGSTAKSYRTLAEGAGVTHGVMRRLLSKLARRGALINECRSRCHSYYALVNWEKYQAEEAAPVHRRPSGGSTGGSTGGSVIKNIKKDKKYIVGTRCSPQPPPKPQVQDLSHLSYLGDKLWKSIQSWKPNHKPPPNAQRAKWLEDMEKLHRIDGVSLERIAKVLDWLPTHVGSNGFTWAAQIRSGRKLRDKWEQLEGAMMQQRSNKLRAPPSKPKFYEPGMPDMLEDL